MRSASSATSGRRATTAQPMPELLDSKLPILVPLARGAARPLPVHAGQGPRRRDRMGEEPPAHAADLRGGTPRSRRQPGREPPIPVDLFVRVFAGYERAKARAGRIDFDDLLVETVDLLESDAEAAETVRARKRWFSVDEYQDTNPLQQRLLELWLGRPAGRVRRRRRGPDDLHVHRRHERVPDEFADRYPGARVVTLSDNYRSTPAGPGAGEPAARRRPAGRSASWRRGRPARSRRSPRSRRPRRELRASSRRIRALIARRHAPAEIAVLVRMNAQLAPIEAALTRAGIPYQVRGVRFFDRPEVRGADRSRAARARPMRTRRRALAGAIRAAAGPTSSGYERRAPVRAGPATRRASGRPRSTRCSASSTTASAPTAALDARRRISRSSTRRARAGSARARPTA